MNSRLNFEGGEREGNLEECNNTHHNDNFIYDLN